MDYDYTLAIKQAYLNKHIIEGDFKISFNIEKIQNLNKQTTQKYEITRFITNMQIFCNDINVLKNKNKNFNYEECHNQTKKYKKYIYVIYVTYMHKWNELLSR